MTDIDIKYGNELIAEYAGFTDVEGFSFDKYSLPDNFRNMLLRSHVQDLNFDNSWNWLMLVLEMIEHEEGVYSVELHIGSISAIYADETFEEFPGNIESAFKCVVNYLKWKKQKEYEDSL